MKISFNNNNDNDTTYNELLHNGILYVVIVLLSK